MRMVYVYPPSALRIPITRRVPISKIFPTARYRITATRIYLPNHPAKQDSASGSERIYGALFTRLR